MNDDPLDNEFAFRITFTNELRALRRAPASNAKRNSLLGIQAHIEQCIAQTGDNEYWIPKVVSEFSQELGESVAGDLGQIKNWYERVLAIVEQEIKQCGDSK